MRFLKTTLSMLGPGEAQQTFSWPDKPVSGAGHRH
jgi:hypothetical protein